MLLLGAVVLVLGFFAIGALVGKAPGFVENLEGSNTSLISAAEALLADADGVGGPDLPVFLCSSNTTPEDASAAVESVFRSQGLTVEIQLSYPTPPPAAPPFAAVVTLSDGIASVEFRFDLVAAGC